MSTPTHDHPTPDSHFVCTNSWDSSSPSPINHSDSTCNFSTPLYRQRTPTHRWWSVTATQTCAIAILFFNRKNIRRQVCFRTVSDARRCHRSIRQFAAQRHSTSSDASFVSSSSIRKPSSEELWLRRLTNYIEYFGNIFVVFKLLWRSSSDFRCCNHCCFLLYLMPCTCLDCLIMIALAGHRSISL